MKASERCCDTFEQEVKQPSNLICYKSIITCEKCSAAHLHHHSSQIAAVRCCQTLQATATELLQTRLLWEKLEEEMSRRVAAAVTVWPEDVSLIWEENQRQDRGHTKVIVGKCSEIPSGPTAKSFFFFLLFKHIPVVQHTGGQETAETPRPR